MEFFRRLSHPLAFEYTILLNSMTEMKEVAEMRRHLENRNRQGNPPLHEELEELFKEMEDLHHRLQLIQQWLKHESANRPS